MYVALIMSATVYYAEHVKLKNIFTVSANTYGKFLPNSYVETCCYDRRSMIAQ
ncbi:MAG: hypothetical protein JWM78_3122 [Verrucomicrobiaceae bacterium]|nr:hypothetical protein [Verrucomicrobiaceae bacterium]